MGILKGDAQTTTDRPTSISGGFNAILDRGAEFEGKLTFEGTVRIDGKFKGEIVSEANLVFGESGKVEADIKVGAISVSGEVSGNITARSKVELHAPAIVKGNIQTPSLIIEEGVLFEGSCAMDKGPQTSKYPKPKTEALSPSIPGPKKDTDLLRP
ncbi:MAG: polymer-forming cytoskeletal protein [Pseudomonadota bacterium]